MRFLLWMLLAGCGRQVWRAPDPNTRDTVLVARIDATNVASGVFSIKTPKGQWAYARNADRGATFPVNQAKMAYVTTLLMQLVDQRKVQLDQPASDFVTDQPDQKVRDLASDPAHVASVEQIVRLAGGDAWPALLERNLTTPLRMLSTTVADDAISTSVADLVTFGHALGEGSLLTAANHSARLLFRPLGGYDGYGLGIGASGGLIGHFGDGCIVMHEPVSSVTIAALYVGELDAPGLVGSLLDALH